jgi:hypothetical protein
MDVALLRNRHRIALLSTVFLLSLLLFIFSSEATFYEIRGKVLWRGTALRAVSAYLLNDAPQINISDKEATQTTAQKSFNEEYAALHKENNEASGLSDAKVAKEARKKIRNNLEKLVKRYKVNALSLDKKGEFYLNVSPGIPYHIFILKKEGFLRKSDTTNFWLENIYFNPGEVLEPKEYIFNETNAVTW